MSKPIDKNKYWIKTGTDVAHKDYPNRKMVVEKIVKTRKEKISETGEKYTKTFIVGVNCHWMTDDGSYGRGQFLTTELMPFDLAIEEFANEPKR
jgi:hypothetical protein|tara:strand:- start:1045 stop:1326 length:282 start_codon:yes stop_codon:yes gene_type:complete